MRISLIQMNSRANCLEVNVERACSFIERAAREKAELAVLPEFFNREYFPQYRDYKYMDYAETDEGYTQTRMKEAARQHGIWLVSTIFEMERPGLYFDTAMMISPEGQITGKYRKVHPAALLSLEKIYFRGGSTFPVFQIGEWTVGISTCYDNLFPESCRCLALRGAELIIAPYATPIDDPWGKLSEHPRLGKRSIFRRLQSRGPGRRMADVGQEHDHLSGRQDSDPGRRCRRSNHLLGSRAGGSRPRAAKFPAIPGSQARCLRKHYGQSRRPVGLKE